MCYFNQKFDRTGIMEKSLIINIELYEFILLYTYVIFYVFISFINFFAQ